MPSNCSTRNGLIPTGIHCRTVPSHAWVPSGYAIARPSASCALRRMGNGCFHGDVIMRFVSGTWQLAEKYAVLQAANKLAWVERGRHIMTAFSTFHATVASY